mgnify:CR=1 FL=1
MANYKVVFHPNIDSSISIEFEKECPSLEIAKSVEDAISDYTLFLHDSQLMQDFSNYAQILVEDEDGDWVEFDDDEI